MDSLRKFGVPAVCIRNNLTSLLSHDSLTLQEKLRQLEPYPELGVFVHHPKFGRLFDDVDTIVLRVETFRAIDKRQITFTACTCSAKEYDVHFLSSSTKVLKIFFLDSLHLFNSVLNFEYHMRLLVTLPTVQDIPSSEYVTFCVRIHTPNN